jgi:ureidoglycolate lyase
VELIARPLVADAFLHFGEVLEAPIEPGQRFFNSTLGNLRASASPNLRIVNKLPTALPLKANLLERHEFSSQTFLPLEVGRILIVVAPHASEGGPDVKRAQALAVSQFKLRHYPSLSHFPSAGLHLPVKYIAPRTDCARSIRTAGRLHVV